MKICKIILPVIFLFLFSFCKKNGTGGKATIKATVSHHEKIIPGATVYIKYGAKEFPGSNPSSYDANYSAPDGTCEIKDLLRGDYYLYAVGFDSSIGELVKGGVPVKIKSRDKRDTQDVTVAVTED